MGNQKKMYSARVIPNQFPVDKKTAKVKMI